MVQVSPSYGDSARPILQDVLADMRAVLPSGMFPIIDAVGEMFEADINRDTASIIAGDLKIYNTSPEGNQTSEQEAGMLCAAFGRYQQGRDILEKYVAGDHISTSGMRFPRLLYYHGVAEEGLGNIQKAITNYQDVLRYWSKPEVEVEEIKGARERLARLTG